MKVLLTALLMGVMLLSITASADTFQGTLFYTHYTGGNNVWSLDFHYNDATNAVQLTNNHSIAAVNGADGIIFAPSGNLLIGGQGADVIHEITATGTPVSDTNLRDQSYHLTLSPDGSKVYTSNFSGPLSTAGLTGGHLNGSATINAVTGNDNGLTQIAFAPNGNVFYVNGGPNGGGNLGMIDLVTMVTARDFSGVNAAHGLIYDPFTQLMTIFGHGHTGTFDTNGANLLQSGTQFTCDFDQGAVDGLGHALVAGCDQVTFIDYSKSHDITNPDFYQVFNGPTDNSYPNFAGIDDVAPLVGPGSNPSVPEPGSMVLLSSGLASMAGFVRRRLKK